MHILGLLKHEIFPLLVPLFVRLASSSNDQWQTISELSNNKPQSKNALKGKAFPYSHSTKSCSNSENCFIEEEEEEEPLLLRYVQSAYSLSVAFTLVPFFRFYLVQCCGTPIVFYLEGERLIVGFIEKNGFFKKFKLLTWLFESILELDENPFVLDK